MKKSASVAVAAALLLSGISAASAASHMSKGAGGATTAGDTLALSATQQKEVWKDLSRHATNQTAPSGFNATVGTAIPSGISLYPLPRQAARDVARGEALSLRHDPGQDRDREPVRQEDRRRRSQIAAAPAGWQKRRPAAIMPGLSRPWAHLAMRRLAALVFLMCWVPAVAGAESPDAEIRAALEHWMADFNAGHADKVCDIFAPSLRADVAVPRSVISTPSAPAASGARRFLALVFLCARSQGDPRRKVTWPRCG